VKGEDRDLRRKERKSEKEGHKGEGKGNEGRNVRPTSKHFPGLFIHRLLAVVITVENAFFTYFFLKTPLLSFCFSAYLNEKVVKF
jgi:hypothetical protein